MNALSKVVVVGGGAAGVAAIEGLRRLGYDRSLVLLGDEPTLPYDRPPLSKQVLLGDWDLERIRLRDEAHYRDLDIELRHGRATGLDVEKRQLRLEGGSVLDFDGAIIATGVRPRRLPDEMHLAGVHVLRGQEDVLGLRDALLSARHLVIIGAGFLGMEVASVTRSLGLDVTVVDPLSHPMLRQVGAEVGGLVAELHREQGVSLRLGVGVERMVRQDDRVSGVELSDGTVLPADCVLVAIGAVPAMDWLEGSGLTLGNGVECDEFCRAAPGVYSAGDVASWVNPRYGRRMRLEHRMNATEQGTNAARNLVQGDVEPFTPLPYFWSDQCGAKIQAHGVVSGDSELTIEEGSLEERRFVAMYRTNGRPTGVLAWNLPTRILPYRKILLEQGPEVLQTA